MSYLIADIYPRRDKTEYCESSIYSRLLRNLVYQISCCNFGDNVKPLQITSFDLSIRSSVDYSSTSLVQDLPKILLNTNKQALDLKSDIL